MARMDADAIDAVVRRGDLDELVRSIDDCCATGAWDALERLRLACERAHETGRQLWPAAAHAAYRLALEAPAPFAAAMLVEGPARFTLGPLAEVAAQTHTWRELAPHVPVGAVAVIAAHERVVRGEDVEAAPPVGPVVLELPWRLASFEPTYPLAEYAAHEASFPAPELPAFQPLALPTRAPDRTRDDVTAALLEATSVWVTESNGRADAAAVAGDAAAAIAALGVRRARAIQVSTDDALRLVAWAGASGGAHGRRRGAAAGRFAAWWLGAALGALLDDWPPASADVAAALEQCRFWAWDAAEPATGWRLQVAIEHTRRGTAWAVAASDAA
jgi:hypothetical protein